MRRRLVIEVDENGHVDVGPLGGTMFSLGAGGRLRLMERRLVVDFSGEWNRDAIADTLGLQVVTDREQALSTALMVLAVKADPRTCGMVCETLTAAGFQV